MGEYAEMMLDGTFDSVTGEYLGDGCGYPRTLTKGRHDSIQKENRLNDKIGKGKRGPKCKIKDQYAGMFQLQIFTSRDRLLIDKFDLTPFNEDYDIYDLDPELVFSFQKFKKKSENFVRYNIQVIYNKKKNLMRVYSITEEYFNKYFIVIQEGIKDA